MFEKFPKIARLNRDVVITEKIDGTNAQIHIVPSIQVEDKSFILGYLLHIDMVVLAGSRSRYLKPGEDNFGFGAWVKEHGEELIEGLGEGRHFGEWWGKGIQRGYDLPERRFSLFNTSKWKDERPSCCHVVPTLWEGLFDTHIADYVLSRLDMTGSHAHPGFMDPEGIVIYHPQGHILFKATIKNDEEGKGTKVNGRNPNK